MNDVYGYRDIAKDPVSPLSNPLLQSPPGRQLSIDGNLVISVVTEDPNTSTEVPPNGSPVLYIRAGVKELWAFDRENGWQLL